LSNNNGIKWQKLRIKGYNKKDYITALALSGKKIVIGTSYNGIYLLKNKKYRKIKKGLPGEPYSKNISFTEEISKIYIDKKNNIFVGLAFGKGLYFLKNNKRKFKKIKLGEKNNIEKNRFNIISILEKNKKIFFSTNDSIYEINKKYKNIKKIFSIKSKTKTYYSFYRYNNLFFKIKNKYVKRKNPKNKIKAIYLSIPAIKRNLKYYIKKIKKTEINAIVIDMKDDYGNILYNSKIKEAQKIKSIRNSINIKKLLKKLKDNKIYSIARIVTFKDKNLFKAYNYKYSIKNKRTNKPWRGNKHEYWVDPYSTFVQYYNIKIAKELELLGFDEIQFDYIRFPSDGNLSLCKYTFNKYKNSYKSEILTDFLLKAKQNIKIPISVDIYGFNAWYNFGNRIGQDIEEFSKVVDIICPMLYPSHFGNRFFRKGLRKERSYKIILESGIRSNKLIYINSKTKIRPYLQAFKLFAPTFGKNYILNQIKGSKDGKMNGYIFWNARGKYNVLFKSTINKQKK